MSSRMRDRMHRGLLWLLALLVALLPVAGMAEQARLTSVSFQAEEDGLNQVLNTWLGLDTDTDGTLARAVAPLLGSATVDFLEQDNAVSLTVKVSGNELFSLSAEDGGEGKVLIRTGLLPGLAVSWETGEATEVPDEGVGLALVQAVSAWAVALGCARRRVHSWAKPIPAAFPAW